MLIRRIIELGGKQQRLLLPLALSGHSKTCLTSQPNVCFSADGAKKDTGPASKSVAGGGVCDSVQGGIREGGAGGAYGGVCGVKRGSVAEAAASGPTGIGVPSTGIKRALKPGKCRMGFIPEEWFLFFKPMTGVSGPYIFMFVLGNYLVSKEIFVMEHEYYLGLSIATVIYIITTRFGKMIGSILDKKVDAIANEYEKGRKDEIAHYNAIVAEAELSKWRAEGQKLLMDAKKVNISMQLEAVYRERVMLVYNRVRECMDYHIQRNKILRHIHHKWIVQWVLEQVHKSITSEFKKQALISAINDLNAIADARVKK